jgi:hypothetical protein
VTEADARPDAAHDSVGPLTHAYRGAVTGADGYRAVRSALRLERGILRIGNRFVPIDRFREIAFVALGNAAASFALAAWEGVGERMTQGIIAGPTPPPPSIPFKSWELPPGLPGIRPGVEIARAVEELAAGLGPKDLLILLLSPGSLSGLSLPPAGWSDSEWNALLRTALGAGASGTDVALLARTLGTGPAGGRLGRMANAQEVDTLLIERGDGAAAVGGGPTVPLRPDEPELALQLLDRLARQIEVPTNARAALAVPASSAPPTRRAGWQRPVVLLGPRDALGGASDALVERRWVCRLAALTLLEPPEVAAGRLIERSEEILTELGGIPGRGDRSGHGSAGLAVFAGTTLALPEGMPEEGPIDRFLKAAAGRLTRRGSVVAILPTAGSARPDRAGGLVVARPGDERVVDHPFSMRTGITDVGPVAVVLVRPAE